MCEYQRQQAHAEGQKYLGGSICPYICLSVCLSVCLVSVSVPFRPTTQNGLRHRGVAVTEFKRSQVKVICKNKVTWLEHGRGRGLRFLSARLLTLYLVVVCLCFVCRVRKR